MVSKIEQNIKGDNNTQEHIENQNIININIPLDEVKIRQISSQTAREIAKEYFVLGQDLANSRMQNLEDVVMNRFKSIENGYFAFSDPSFILSYRKAKIQSAITDEESSYQMLSELLVHRHEKRDQKYSKTAIDGAIEIVNQIPDASLVALTIFTCINNNILPTVNQLDAGLRILSNLYSSILICDLPIDSKWMDQLDILKAIRIDNVNKFKTFKEIIGDLMSNYSKAGIKKDSQEYIDALEIEKRNNIKILIKNALMDEEYYILPVFEKSQINKLTFYSNGKNVYPPKEVFDAINSLMDLYTKDKSANEKALNSLIDKIDGFVSLKKIHMWWDSLSNACYLTEIGRVLGHANAQKCYKGFPPLD